jgi:hypothetical protein
MDVPHEATWAFHLGRRLGPGFQVLNFGVDGYGVDQAWLRYLRDARPWRPEVAILGVIQDDFHRATGVYAFLNRPMWGFPFARPRLVLEDGALRRLPGKVPSPEWIFSRERIGQLPHLGLEPGWDEAQWTPRWLDRSFLLRFLRSRFPRWDAAGAEDEAAALGAAIVRSFLRDAAADGARPLVLYLPVRGDFTRGAGARWALGMLRAEGIPFEDLTDCVQSVPESERFVEGHGHYSPRTNEAVAEHVRRLLR